MNIYLHLFLFNILILTNLYGENADLEMKEFSKIYVTKFSYKQKQGEIHVMQHAKGYWYGIIKNSVDLNFTSDETFELSFTAFKKIPADISGKYFVIFFSFGDNFGKDLVSHFGKNMKSNTLIHGRDVISHLNSYYEKNLVYVNNANNLRKISWQVKAAIDETSVRKGVNNDDVTIYRGLIGIEFAEEIQAEKE